jgi:hypothetical protein
MDGMTFVHIIFLDGFVFDGSDLCLLVFLLRIVNPVRSGQ